MRKDSEPIPVVPHWANVDWRWRKKMIWEMYVTALDTVALAKVRKVWPEYVVSNDLIILKVVRQMFAVLTD
jgi:hypothetical protein